MVSFYYVKTTYYGGDDEEIWIDWEDREEFDTLVGAKKFALKKLAQIPDVQPAREWVTISLWWVKDDGNVVEIDI